MSYVSKESRVRAHLGFAAMLNGTVVDPTWVGNLREALRYEVEDYFASSPQESSQFSEPEMLALLDEYNETGLLQMLHHLGKCPFETSSGGRWSAAVEELRAGVLPVCELSTGPGCDESPVPTTA